MKKKFFSAAAAALLVLTGCSSRLPEEELRQARERIDRYLFNEETLTQSEMTILSSYELNLAFMEHYLTEYRIWNQPGYDKIEKQFMADCELWNKKLEEDEAKGDKWIALEKEYEQLLRPYAGKSWSEVPTNIIQKAADISKAARKAREEYFATFDMKPMR